MIRLLVLLTIAALPLLAGCARVGLPFWQPLPAMEQSQVLSARPTGVQAEPRQATAASSRGLSVALQPSPSALPSPTLTPTEELPAWVLATAVPVERTPTPDAAESRHVPQGQAAAESTPFPAKQGPDEPFAFVDLFQAECEVLLDRVPALPQLRNLSCEAATIRMVLAACGIEASEEEVLARMGLSDNPHEGFRGDVDGYGHDPELKDYGTYAEVVGRVLVSFGAPAEVVRGMSDWELRQAVRSGKAVIVWVTAEEDPLIIEEDGYRLVEEEHVYVVVGLFEDGRLLVHDPWGVRADSGRPGTFPVWAIQQWDLFDRMAVVVPLP